MAYLYLFVSDQPEPQVAYIGDLTLSCSNWGNGYTISWFDCETQTEIPGENDQVFVGEPGGQYAVISTYYGCTDTSECYTIQTAATDELTQNNFTVAPNPANDQISVTLSADFNAEEYTLFQLDGKLIATGKLTAPLTVISIDHVPNGPYLLRINGQYLHLLKN